MVPQDKPIKLSDLVSTAPLQPAQMSDAQREAFVRDVGTEMDRLGFTKANEITAESERLTESDYSVRINAR